MPVARFRGSFSGTSGQGRRSNSDRYSSDGKLTERAAACRTPFSGGSAAYYETTLEEYVQTLSLSHRCRIFSDYYQECMAICQGSYEFCERYKKFMSGCPDATKGDAKLTERAAACETPFSAESAAARKPTFSFEEYLQKLGLKRGCRVLSNFYQECMTYYRGQPGGGNEICDYFKKFMSDCPGARKG